MRIQLLSDLHFEHDADRGEAFVRALPVLSDVLVLAGDIIPVRSLQRVQRTFEWLCERFPQVIYVAGNHEYYKTEPAEADRILEQCSALFANLHVLNASVVELQGTRFVGATLWFPELPNEARYRPFMSDFELIENFVPWVHETHAAQLAFLEANVRRGDVVVTHHLPHPGSIATQFLRSPMNRFFVVDDAAPLVERCGASVWMHGHTHMPCDYVAGETRVVCNPRGYPGENKPPVELDLVIDV